MGKRAQTISWCVLAGTQNIGDEAIFLGGLKRLQKEHGKNFKLNCFVANTEQFIKSHKINKALPIFHWYKPRNVIKSLKALIESDKVYYGGGAMLQFDHRMMSFLIFSKLLGKPTEVMACGSMPLNKVNRKIRLILSRIALNMVDSISVRDVESRTQLKRIGVRKRIDIEQDLAYLTIPKRKKSRKRNKNKKLKILMNVKKHQREAKNRKEVIGNIKRTLEFLEKRQKIDLEAVLFNTSDLQTVKEISEKTNREIIIKIFPPLPKQFFKIMEKYDLILSMRKHPIIFADMLNLPFFAFDNDPAMKWQVKKMGKLEYFISCDMTKKEIKKKVINLLKAKEA